MFLFGEQTPRDWNRTPQEWRSLTPTLTSLQKTADIHAVCAHSKFKRRENESRLQVNGTG